MSIYTRYKPGEIVRNISTGEILFVIHVYKIAILVASLSENHGPTQPKILLERDFPYWIPDQDLECKIDKRSSILDPALIFTAHAN